jgi:ParB-like chromosome segregation protein Spo0J
MEHSSTEDLADIECVIDLEETREVRPLDPEHVERLALVVDDLPPIGVVKLAGSRFGVLDGYHTREAHRQAGKKTIRVLVHDLAPEEWHRFAVRLNLAHGLPLTLDQRKNAALYMLESGDRRSDRAIATDCGLDHKTVAKLRSARGGIVEATGEDPQLRVGRDGRSRRVVPNGTRLESNQQPDDESIDEQDVADGHLYRGVYPSPYALHTFLALLKDHRLHDGFHTLLQATVPDGLVSGPLSELVDPPWNVIADLASWGDWELCNAVIDRYVARFHELKAEIDLDRPGWADRLIALMNDLPPRCTLRCKCEEGESRSAIQHELAYSHGGEGSA